MSTSYLILCRLYSRIIFEIPFKILNKPKNINAVNKLKSNPNDGNILNRYLVTGFNSELELSVKKSVIGATAITESVLKIACVETIRIRPINCNG
tara:strand:- start:288 stop:572 length:285 start_codon:yes stop_codon:yes gene_type:complete